MAKKKMKDQQYPDTIYIDRWGWEDDDLDWSGVTVLENPEDAIDIDNAEDGSNILVGVYKLVKMVRVTAKIQTLVEDVK